MIHTLKIAAALCSLAAIVLTLTVFVLYQRNRCVGVATDLRQSQYLPQPPPPLSEAITLRLVTFNIQDLYLVGHHRTTRMRHIARVLATLDPDIVGFQESFIHTDRTILIEALAASRLQHHAYYPSGTAGSGLLISSAWPIRETFFHRYANAGPAWRVWEGDFWGGKGVALARIETPVGMVDFYNTHAQAGYGRTEYREVRCGQMEELAAFINSSRMGSSPAFLVGDMNSHIGQEDYETAAAGAALLRAMTIDSGIDHIFSVQDAGYKIEMLDTVRIWEEIDEDGKRFSLSDHPGFMSTIRVVPIAASEMK